jgi:hypothetical protein
MDHGTDARLYIVAAYREMPGLRLTVEQASRLFDLDHEPCEALLTALVADGLLQRHQQAFVMHTAA